MTRDDIKQRITALHMEIRDYTRMLEDLDGPPVFKLPYEIAPDVRKVIGGNIWSLVERSGT